MLVATQVSLEEFQSNPDPHYYDLHELHNGEIVVVSNPTGEHVDLQKRLERILGMLLGGGWTMHREFYVSVAAESRRVDVAAVETARWEEQKKKAFYGSPRLVVETLSPSNTALDVDHLRYVCIREGAYQFWVINMDLETVMVFRPGSPVANICDRSGYIPLSEFVPEAAISVDAIFADIES